MKLYHYPHCPFCQRVRLFLGFKGIEYESITPSYADKDTPMKLTGHKTLPIMDFGDGKVMGESLDIIREIEYRFPNPIGFVGPVESKFQWASMVAVGIPRYFDLLLPWYPDAYKQEFGNDPEGLKYYKEHKEAKRGVSFEILKEQSPAIFADSILPHMQEIMDAVEDDYFVMGPTFSVADCVLAADLSGLRCVGNIELPSELSGYIDRVERQCRTRLLEA